MCFQSGDAGRAAERAAQAEARRQSNIQEATGSINRNFSQFNDQWYDQRRNEFLDYANPQLSSQFQQAKRNVLSSLARSGNLNSSVGARRIGELLKERDLQLSNIQNQATDFTNQIRGDVESRRANLINLANTGADPAQTAQVATNAAQALSAPRGFSPIGQLFANVTALLAQDREAKAFNYPGVFSRGGNAAYRVNGSGSGGTQKIINS